jgi:cytochrome c biogenesis protein CcdA
LLPGFCHFSHPCVLPLIPGYIAFVSGLSIDHMGFYAQIEMRYLMMPVMSISIGYMAAYHKGS